MILHTLNKPPSNRILSQQLSDTIDSQDTVLLIEDGAYQLSSPDFRTTEGHWSMIANNIYALRQDIDARGMSDRCEAVKLVDYQQFVALSAEHQTVISWY
jgi:tRNA 2-thiouridine synthesizing protein B